MHKLFLRAVAGKRGIWNSFQLIRNMRKGKAKWRNKLRLNFVIDSFINFFLAIQCQKGIIPIFALLKIRKIDL